MPGSEATSCSLAVRRGSQRARRPRGSCRRLPACPRREPGAASPRRTLVPAAQLPITAPCSSPASAIFPGARCERGLRVSAWIGVLCSGSVFARVLARVCVCGVRVGVCVLECGVCGSSVGCVGLQRSARGRQPGKDRRKALPPVAGSSPGTSARPGHKWSAPGWPLASGRSRCVPPGLDMFMFT